MLGFAANIAQAFVKRMRGVTRNIGANRCGSDAKRVRPPFGIRHQHPANTGTTLARIHHQADDLDALARLQRSTMLYGNPSVQGTALLHDTDVVIRMRKQGGKAITHLFDRRCVAQFARKARDLGRVVHTRLAQRRRLGHLKPAWHR
jgi:hypothetical protein